MDVAKAALFVAVVQAAWAGPWCGADDGWLSIGDPAPPLQIARWLGRGNRLFGGDPAGPPERGAIHAVTFVDTRSEPCRESLPHLADLAGRFRRHGVAFVAVATDPPEREAEVVDYFRDLDGSAGFHPGIDRHDDSRRRQRHEEPEGLSWRAWMTPAGEAGVPTTFVVAADGRVAWIGHPLDGLDDVVARMVAGTFDPDAEAAASRRAERLDEEARTAVELGHWERALGIVDEMVAVQPRLAGRAAGMRVEIVLFQKHDLDAGVAAAAALLEGPAAEDPQLLNDIAQRILDLPAPPPRAVAVAAALATRADTLLDHANPWVVDTLAHARFLAGDREGAVALQEKAVELITAADDRRERKAMRRRLRHYRESLAEEPAP